MRTEASLRGRVCWGMVLLLVLAGAGCKERTPTFRAKENQPPVIKQLGIRPANPAPGADLRAEVQYQDPDGDTVVLEYRWLVDGEVVQEGGRDSLPGTEVEAGAEIGLMVRARDPEHIGDWISAKSVRIPAGPEVKLVRVWIEPSEPTGDSTLEAKVDAGEVDPVSLTLYYRWWVNGKPVPEVSEPYLEGEHFTHGDMVAVEVSLDEEFAAGKTKGSGSVRILNQPPEITSVMNFEWDGSKFLYQIEAQDPDDDPLSYALDKGPAGMMVDAKTGLVSWTPRPEQAGNHEVQVSVNDGAGGRVVQIGEVAVEHEELKTKR